VKHFDPDNIILNKNGQRIVGFDTIKLWLAFVAIKEKKRIRYLCYSLVSDEVLLQMNQKHLRHNTYTDIITFDLSDANGAIEGDVYISYDRVKENARTFHVKRSDEIKRVFVHGLLHLCGFSDKTTTEKLIMRSKENYYLEKFADFDKK
jgi:probable rRNA maturation factor